MTPPEHREAEARPALLGAATRVRAMVDEAVIACMLVL
jgi:hypothetical protein